MKYHLAQTTSAFLVMASLVPCAEAADTSGASVPRDTHIYSRPAVPEDFRPLPAAKALAPFVLQFSVRDAVVSNFNPLLKNTDIGGHSEVSIGVVGLVEPLVVLTAFSSARADHWGVSFRSEPLWVSRNGGRTWGKNLTINPPPGAVGVPGCPCDQTVDFDPFTRALAGTFLTSTPPFGNVFSALNESQTHFDYLTVDGVAQLTNHLDVPSVNKADQPWLLVGRKPGG